MKKNCLLLFLLLLLIIIIKDSFHAQVKAKVKTNALSFTRNSYYNPPPPPSPRKKYFIIIKKKLRKLFKHGKKAAAAAAMAAVGGIAIGRAPLKLKLGTVRVRRIISCRRNLGAQKVRIRKHGLGLRKAGIVSGWGDWEIEIWGDRRGLITYLKVTLLNDIQSCLMKWDYSCFQTRSWTLLRRVLKLIDLNFQCADTSLMMQNDVIPPDIPNRELNDFLLQNYWLRDINPKTLYYRLNTSDYFWTL